MTQSKVETFEVSIPVAPPGLPPKVRNRLAALGPGNEISREGLRQVIASDSAANMFMAKGVNEGWLVPTGWNRYQIPPEGILQVLGRIANPLHRRLVSWSAVLPEALGRLVCFAAPRLWRDTDLSIDNLLTVVPLKPGERRIAGLPPQIEGFYQDLAEPPETWRMVHGSEKLAEFHVPAAADVSLVLVASLDPRWRNAFDQISHKSSRQVADRVAKLDRPMEAPRGAKDLWVGAGPPHRLRLLVPPWFLEKVLNGTKGSIRAMAEAGFS